jgi:hypothetical protein
MEVIEPRRLKRKSAHRCSALQTRVKRRGPKKTASSGPERRTSPLLQVYRESPVSHASILRRIAARLKKVEDDLAAVVEVYSDPASTLRTRLDNHPAPQDVVLSPIHETG